MYIPQIQYTSTSAVQNIMQEYSDHRLHEVKAQKLYACGYARVIIPCCSCRGVLTGTLLP